MARASASEPTAPVATICTAMFPSAVASVGPASTAVPVASAVNCARSAILRAATDHANGPEMPPAHLLERVEHQPVLERQTFEDGPGIGARLFRRRLAGRRAVRVDGAGHVGRVEERRVVGIQHGPETRDVRRRRPSTSSSYERRSPRSAHVRRHAWSSHSPPMFFRTRNVPFTPPSFVKFSSRLRSVMIGAGISVPRSDHVPQLRNAVSAAGLDRCERRAGIVTGGRDHERVAELAARACRQRTEHRTRSNDLAKQVRRYSPDPPAGPSPTRPSARPRIASSSRW